MTKDEFIAMVRKAGITVRLSINYDTNGSWEFEGEGEDLERFAALVAEISRADEREKAMQRCRYYLKYQCLPIVGSDDRTPYHDGVEDTAENIEVSIRDMGNT